MQWASSAGGNLQDPAISHFRHVPRRKGKWALIGVGALLRHLLALRVDAYHCCGLFPLLPTAVAALLRHKPLVYDSYELYYGLNYSGWKGLKRVAVWLYEKMLCPRCRAVIQASQERADYFGRLYNVRRVYVVENFPRNTDLARCVPARRMLRDIVCVPPSYRIVLYHGSLIRGRYLETLIDSMALVRNNMVLVLMGAGECSTVLQQRAAARGLLNRKVHFVQPVAYPEVLEYISSADLGVVLLEDTCLNNRYAAPNKLYEFLSLGVPVVVNDMPSLVRVVYGPHAGVVVSQVTPEGLASALDAAAEACVELTRVARRVAAERRYVWERQEQVIAGLYSPG